MRGIELDAVIFYYLFLWGELFIIRTGTCNEGNHKCSVDAVLGLWHADHSLGKVRGHHLGWGHQADEGQEEEPGCAPRPLSATQAQGSDSGLLHRGSENAA